MYSKISTLFENKDKRLFKLILFLNFLVFFLEFASLASIPIFVGLVIDANFLTDKINAYLGYNFISTMNNKDIIALVAIFIVIIFILKNAFLLLLTYMQGNFFKRIKLNIADKLFNYYVNCSYLFHLKNNPSKLSRNISIEIQGIYTYLHHLISIIRESLAILVIIILLIILNPTITTIVFLFLAGIIFFYLKKIRPFIREKANKNLEFRNSIIQTINETFGSIKDIKILTKEKEIGSFFNKNLKQMEKNIFYFYIMERLPRLFLELFSIITIITACLVYLSLNENIIDLFPVIALVVVSAVRFIPAFSALTSGMTYIRLYEPSINVLVEEIKKANLHNNFEPKTNEIINKNINININKNFFSVRDVSFSYPESSAFPLKNISMNIDEGSKIGITGKTGAGKSTLFHLMLGLLKPNSGNIFYKGEDIFNNLYQWRKEIGYISQNIYLLDSSVKKNIVFNFLNETIDNKKLEKAINIASLKEKILEMPNGIETKVGTDGLKLSGGERQRIALARAVYREPNIFFMDESTSALDDKTEELIMNNIENNFSDKTMIMIAHRKTTIEKCDKVWNLVNGSIN